MKPDVFLLAYHDVSDTESSLRLCDYAETATAMDINVLVVFLNSCVQQCFKKMADTEAGQAWNMLQHAEVSHVYVKEDLYDAEENSILPLTAISTDDLNVLLENHHCIAFGKNDPHYLYDWQTWNEHIFLAMAEEDGIEITDAHKTVCAFLRHFYQTHHTTPPVRAVVKHVKEKHGDSVGNSAHLAKLFPKGPLLQASRWAGLPKPKKCVS